MAASTHPRDLFTVCSPQGIKMEAKSEVLEEERGEGVDGINRSIDDDGTEASPSGSAPSDDGEDLNAYELERERNIARNRARMEAVVEEAGRSLKKRAITAAKATKSSTRRHRRPRQPRPSSSSSPPPQRTMPTRASRRLQPRSGSSHSPSPGTLNKTPPDCRAAGIASRSARPVIPSRFVRGTASNPNVSDDAEALRELNSFRASYMSRAALFNRVMAVSNLAKLEDFAEVLEKGGQSDLAALAREKSGLMKKGNPSAVKEFLLRSKEREYERREKEAAEAEAEEEDE